MSYASLGSALPAGPYFPFILAIPLPLFFQKRMAKVSNLYLLAVEPEEDGRERWLVAVRPSWSSQGMLLRPLPLHLNIVVSCPLGCLSYLLILVLLP